MGSSDPILDAIDAELLKQESKQLPRQYLGASGIGGNCERALFYSFRWASKGGVDARGLKAIADGHASEQVMIKRLMLVNDVELWVEESGAQIGFSDIGGHFMGNLDGIIKHPSIGTAVWENKATNIKKFETLKKLKAENESTALKKWDQTYYGQAQIYMHYMGLGVHYLTCCTPGGRDMASVLTHYNEPDALALIERAKRVIFGDGPATRISSDPAWFECRWCKHQNTCHGVTLPQVNCRTCAHATPKAEGGWMCEKFACDLSFEAQLEGCVSHRYHPRLLNGTPVEQNEDGEISYRMADGTEYMDRNK